MSILRKMLRVLDRVATMLLIAAAVTVVAIVVVAAVVAVLVGILALQGLIVWALWNALVPSLAGGPSVTFIQGVLLGMVLDIVSAVLGGSARV